MTKILKHDLNPEDDLLGKRLASGCYTVGITVSTFGISIALLNITKWIYVTYGFKYPLFLTATHMCAAYAMSAIMIFVLKLVPQRRQLSMREQIFTVAPFSLLGASSIACGNMALVYLFPSFHEMIQNTTPLWTVICAMVFQGTRYNQAAYLAMIPVIMGGWFCAWAEQSNFALAGLFFSIMAALFRALRAIVQANLMCGQEPIDSVTLLFYAAPFNLGLFLCGSMITEGMAPWTEIWSVPFNGQLVIAGAAICAASYNLFSFLLVGHLGAVGSMVMGNLKTPSIIVSSVLIFGNPCTPMQVLGFVITSSGVYVYNAYGKEQPKQSSQGIEYEMTQTVGRNVEFGLDDLDDDDESERHRIATNV